MARNMTKEEAAELMRSVEQIRNELFLPTGGTISVSWTGLGFVEPDPPRSGAARERAQRQKEARRRAEWAKGNWWKRHREPWRKQRGGLSR